MLGARVTANTATDSICPDLEMPNGLPVEVKGSCTGRWVVYPWRVRREAAYAKEKGKPYLYAFVGYVSNAEPESMRFSDLLSVEILLCTLTEVQDWIAPLKINKAGGGGAGYNREGYNEGYVEVRPKHCAKAPLSAQGRVYGVQVFTALTASAACCFTGEELCKLCKEVGRDVKAWQWNKGSEQPGRQRNIKPVA